MLPLNCWQVLRFPPLNRIDEINVYSIAASAIVALPVRA